ncbi:MAG: hypothetical protein SV775_12925 [Thermodesulfobacteriota bacterium]|nr:hypothetical protein [Thermodesulfobacteriota bacterium]
MPIIEAILGAIFAGLCMGIVSEALYRLNFARSNLLIIDGQFFLENFNKTAGLQVTYIFGTIVHLMTSIGFGIAYWVICTLFQFNPLSLPTISLYVFCLWLLMLFSALPIAGKGFLGSRIGSLVWLEQLLLHAVFGFGLWWSLRIL